MKTRLFHLTLLALCFSSVASFAQRKKSASAPSAGYQTGIGLRAGGYSSGLTIKHFMSGKNNVAVEGLVTTEYAAHGARFTLLLEKHVPVKDLKGLQFYYGAGAHLGAYRGRYYFEDVRYRRGKKYDYYYVYYVDEDRARIAGGADLILGFEYKMDDLPFVIGVDYKPFFEVFNGYTGFYQDAAVNLRFTF
ncbi:hypothetical protein [Hymenobacter sp. GOD-10R]|uniref:hypothetical protein n=1 Tax=Hymenobacter sp. GOD-10R TaxID=3093922 RepID=UPI002D77BCD5|nr:hypothetical protein [Hymenobacter sp. GOD-10R]WRQ27584.1 hypothetical protein SD425_21165 [Hymenobacter sp. GOD-10R]